MKKLYPLLFLSLPIILSACSKELLRDYEDRIEGSWALYEVDKIGFGGNRSSFPFTEGRFVFSSSGRLNYVDGFGRNYEGSWDMRHDRINGKCNTDENGNYRCDDRDVRSLQVTAIDFQTNDVLSEHFDEISFTSSKQFKAFIYAGSASYVFKFRRE